MIVFLALPKKILSRPLPFFVFRHYHRNSNKMSEKRRIGIVWFRNDLRVEDNNTLNEAIQSVDRKKLDAIVPFYCYDRELLEGKSRLLKVPRCGPHRRNFLIESVENLRANVAKRLNSKLFLAYGDPVYELSQLIDKIVAKSGENKVNELVVFASKEVPLEEVEQEERMTQMLTDSKPSGKLRLVWDSTLIHLDDLPFNGDLKKQMPDTFTAFRKKVEVRGGDYEVRRCSSKIKAGFTLPSVDFDLSEFENTSTLSSVTKVEVKEEERSAIAGMKGGEDEAIARVLHYFFKSDGLQRYKATRNGLIGSQYSTKLSHWLALGCVSVRYLYWKVKEYEQAHKANDSTKHAVFEFLWRDFFKFHSLKHDPKRLFLLHGCHTSQVGGKFGSVANYQSYDWKRNRAAFDKWCVGETGFPFVDANMKEMNATGWMSNRGRQNVASFLAKDMEIDWRWGAEYFEYMLIDYDVTSNWGNWQYAAGVGTDPRERIFNVVKQGYDYDEQGEYVKMWLPVLSTISLKFLHCPFMMGSNEERKSNVHIGKHYPPPVVKAKCKWNPSEPRKVNKFAQNAKNSR